MIDPVLAGTTTFALEEGAKFLSKQAREILRAWRARQKDGTAPPPVLLRAPDQVTLGKAHPQAETPSNQAIDALQQLRDAVDLILEGAVSIEDAAAREAIADLRSMVEAALGTDITFAGELPRAIRASDINVLAGEVLGTVTGLRASLDGMAYGATISNVRVETEDVKPGGEVTGVDLTHH